MTETATETAAGFAEPPPSTIKPHAGKSPLQLRHEAQDPRLHRDERGRLAMKKALVAGALGVSGRALINHLVSLPDWEVIGLSRRTPEFRTTAQFISIDLLNGSEVETRLSGIGDITHIFYAALQPAANFFEEVGPNLTMLTNTVETVERVSRTLRKVILIEGAKFYGAHLGPYKTPAKETDPRHMPPNFYYDQEDYLKERSAGKAWSWAALRPSSICGFAVGNPMNMATVIAVYATLCKEMGLAPSLSWLTCRLSRRDGDDRRRASRQSHGVGCRNRSL
jgi:hypothetical protein